MNSRARAGLYVRLDRQHNVKALIGRTITEDTSNHTCLDNVDFALDKCNDGDQQLDKIAEGGVEKTTIHFAKTEGQFFGAVMSD